MDEKNELLNQLEEISQTIKTDNDAYNELNKSLKANKDKVKQLLKTLELSEYVSKNGVKMSITDIDKSFLNKQQTLEFLHNNKLDKFIHTQEYFDEAELTMAICNGEINPLDLSKFKVEKHEIRLNIK